MQYELVDVADELGLGRVYLRVKAWYGNRSAGDPDTTQEFLLFPPSTTITRFVEDRLGQRQTVSGVWHHGWVEVNGEWRRLDRGLPGDPWATVSEPTGADVVANLVDAVEGVLADCEARNVRAQEVGVVPIQGRMVALRPDTAKLAALIGQRRVVRGRST